LEASSAVITKFRQARRCVAATRALYRQPLSAFFTEHRLFSILKIAFETFHFVPSLPSQFSPGDEYSYSIHLIPIETYIIPQNMSTDDFMMIDPLTPIPIYPIIPSAGTRLFIYNFIA
jgi:hypothetical protein